MTSKAGITRGSAVVLERDYTTEAGYIVTAGRYLVADPFTRSSYRRPDRLSVAAVGQGRRLSPGPLGFDWPISVPLNVLKEARTWTAIEIAAPSTQGAIRSPIATSWRSGRAGTTTRPRLGSRIGAVSATWRWTSAPWPVGRDPVCRRSGWTRGRTWATSASTPRRVVSPLRRLGLPPTPRLGRPSRCASSRRSTLATWPTVRQVVDRGPSRGY